MDYKLSNAKLVHFSIKKKYIVELLKRFALLNSKPFGAPMSLSLMLDSNANGKKVDGALFRGMIHSLLYLTASKSNIMLSLYLCARYQVDPKESHLLVIKCIMRYFVVTQHLGLWYRKPSTYILIGYLDMDFASS